MYVAVSPYHLTTRECPALAAFLLGDRAVTLLPVPVSGVSFSDVADAARRAPGYMALMRSWEWTMPLWRAGVITAVFDGRDAADEVRSAARDIHGDDRYAPLRPLMRPEIFEDGQGDETYLQALARDLLRAGPDPAISVPIAAGLDRFALRHGLLAARPQPASLVQRAERAGGQTIFALALPVLVQAEGQRLLTLRQTLAPELAALREAIDRALLEGDPARLTAPARDFGRAFEDRRPEWAAGREDDDIRPIESVVRLTAVTLDQDAALASSVRAMSTLTATDQPSPLRRTGARPAPSPSMPFAPAGPTSTSLASRRLIALYIEPIARPRGR